MDDDDTPLNEADGLADMAGSLNRLSEENLRLDSRNVDLIQEKETHEPLVIRSWKNLWTLDALCGVRNETPRHFNAAYVEDFQYDILNPE